MSVSIPINAAKPHKHSTQPSACDYNASPHAEMPQPAPWYLYIIENIKGQLYTGITNNPERRIRQHRGEIVGGAKALRGKGPLAFKVIFQVGDKSAAARLEYEVKQLPKTKKLAIVSKASFKSYCCVKASLNL
ncbi:GIY-YIG nuclease family protein [Alteromonas sp. A079]|uniref:GIY-YIG nuclease family protein n=1 Tax=Alteromonas sp. A079 TaxID=3410268 RepID=UPI003BA2B131